ncbi:MAG: ATP-binding protein [Spirochaetes bacterium]|nr:ATP-binding protein [Spirochaetota bacterium]
MKELLVISGKGGTGKTVVTGAFASLAENTVIVDCDVDAADLHLLLSPTVKEAHLFKSGLQPVIDEERCTRCGTCRTVCRFDAVTPKLSISHIDCEGCGFCANACPEQAIEMIENVSGEWYISETRYGPFVHAKLGIAEENSGKLVTLVKQQARSVAEESGSDLILIDGSPGIGCPVIASLAGVDCAVVVTEPTISGLHDAGRVIEVAKHFDVPVKVVVNKFDLNEEMTQKTEEYCRNNGIAVLGKIPFCESVVRATVEGKTVVEYDHGEAKPAIVKIWKTLEEELGV